MHSLATKSITSVGVSGNDLRLPGDELIRLYANFRSPQDSEKSRMPDSKLKIFQTKNKSFTFYLF